MSDTESLLHNQDQDSNDFRTADSTMELQNVIEELIEFYPSENPELPSLKHYFFELIESLIKIIALIEIVLGILFTILRSGELINPFMEKSKLYEVVFYFVSLSNIFLFILAVSNRAFHRKYFGDPLTEYQFLIFIFIIFPFGFFSCVNVIINSILSCQDEKNWFYTELFLLLSPLIITSSNIKSLGVPWLPRVLNKFTKLLLVTECLTSYVFNLFVRHTYEFRNIMENYFNVSFQTCNGSSSSKYKSLYKINTFFFSQSTFGYILFTVGFITLLPHDIELKPTLRLQSEKIKINRVSLVLTIINLFLSVLPFAYFIFQNGMNHILEDFSIILHISNTFIFLCGILCLISKALDVIKWEKVLDMGIESNIYDRVFIWAGFLGQLLVCFKELDNSNFYINHSKKLHRYPIYLSILDWPISLLLLFQVLMQACLIELCLDRKWRLNTREEMKSRILYPCFILISVNLAGFIIGIYEDFCYSSNKEPKIMIDRAIVNIYMSYFPRTLIIIQRLHAAVFFMKLYLNTEKKYEVTEAIDN